MRAFSLSFYKDLTRTRQTMYYHNFVCIVFEYFNLPNLDSYNNFRFIRLKISEIINFIAHQKAFFFKTMYWTFSHFISLCWNLNFDKLNTSFHGRPLRHFLVRLVFILFRRLLRNKAFLSGFVSHRIRLIFILFYFISS